MRSLIPFLFVAACASDPTPTATVYRVEWTLQDAATGTPLLCEAGETIVLSGGRMPVTAPCWGSNAYTLYPNSAAVVVDLSADTLHVELHGPANDVRATLDQPISPVANDVLDIPVVIPVTGTGSEGSIALSWSLYYQSPKEYGGAREADVLDVASDGSNITTIGQAMWGEAYELGVPSPNLPVAPFATIVTGRPTGSSRLTLDLRDNGVTTASVSVPGVVVGGRTAIANAVTFSR